MKLKGMWFRILGLMVVLVFITACGGGAGTATDDAAASVPAASVAPEVPTIDPSNQASAAPESSAEASAEASPDAAGASPNGTATDPDPAATATTGAGAIPTVDDVDLDIGSKNFTEQFLLAEMYEQALEEYGFDVNDDNVGLQNETLAQQAIQNDDIDLYPEYVATALQAILGEDLPDPASREAIYDQVVAGYAQLPTPLAVLEPSGFENNQALAMRADRAQELGITTYTDLSTRAGELVMGAPPEFFERPDGLRGLQDTYGGFEFRENRQLDPNLRYPELEAGNVDVIVAFTTDGQLADDQFVVLEDDQQLYPPYQVAPIVRQDVLDQYPQIADILNQVTAALSSNEIMAGLNYQVDGPDGREVEDVAEEFLVQQGIIQDN